MHIKEKNVGYGEQSHNTFMRKIERRRVIFLLYETKMWRTFTNEYMILYVLSSKRKLLILVVLCILCVL